jgi:hypothetical protein
MGVPVLSKEINVHPFMDNFLLSETLKGHGDSDSSVSAVPGPQVNIILRTTHPHDPHVSSE